MKYFTTVLPIKGYQKILYFLLITFTLSSCSGVTPKENVSTEKTITGCDRFNLLQDSLNMGCNPTDIKAIMAKRTLPFEEKLTKAKPEASTADYVNPIALIGVAFDKLTPEDKDINCKLAVSTVERPGMILTDLAAKTFCSEGLVVISDKVTAKDYADGVRNNFADEYWKLANQLDGNNENDIKKINQMNQTFQLIGMRIKEDCSKNIKESCQAQESLIKFAEKLTAAADKEEANEKYLESSDYILEMVCPLKEALDRNESIIKREREIGKISGTSNLTNLNNAGAWIVDLKPKIAQWKKAYLQKTKRNLNFNKDCAEFASASE